MTVIGYSVTFLPVKRSQLRGFMHSFTVSVQEQAEGVAALCTTPHKEAVELLTKSNISDSLTDKFTDYEESR